LPKNMKRIQRAHLSFMRRKRDTMRRRRSKKRQQYGGKREKTMLVGLSRILLSQNMNETHAVDSAVTNGR
jgi:hypothetical protein